MDRGRFVACTGFLRLRDDIDPKTVRRARAASPRSAVIPAPRGPALARGSAAAESSEILSQLENTKNAFELTVGPHRIRLTHLDRVYWPADDALQQPALTKRDLLRYLAQVSP